MVQKAFGGLDTLKKLKTVFDYANFYTKVLKDKPSESSPFHLHYLDAFAGTGEIPHSSDLPLIQGTAEVSEIVGSARRALEIERPFDRYVFADIKRKNTVSLSTLQKAYPNIADRIEISRGDANTTTLQFCNSLGSRDRALVFLDPFGNQVNWETLRVIASTRKIDLWYLFPAGLGVVRQICNDGAVQKDAEASLNRLFGGSDWIDHCIQSEEAPDFFEPNRMTVRKIATADAITRYMIERMSQIFEGGVARSWLPLGRDGVHKFSLLFACSNPSAKASSLAQKVANEIMTRK